MLGHNYGERVTRERREVEGEEDKGVGGADWRISSELFKM